MEKELNPENQSIEQEDEEINMKDFHKKKAATKKQADDSAEKIEELGLKLAEVNDKYLRLYSEFDNYRKRTSKEKADLIKFAGEDVIKSLLLVVDDFERAISAMEKDSSQNPFAEGIVLIYNKLKGLLEQKGLKAIDAKGQKFDENLHEAVTHMPAANEEDKGIVIDELVKGYFLNDKVIRYSKVVVAM